MKRVREAVWKDDDDDIEAPEAAHPKIYGSKATGLSNAGHLRTEFEYVAHSILMLYCSPQVSLRKTEMGHP